MNKVYGNNILIRNDGKFPCYLKTFYSVYYCCIVQELSSYIHCEKIILAMYQRNLWNIVGISLSLIKVLLWDRFLLKFLFMKFCLYFYLPYVYIYFLFHILYIYIYIDITKDLSVFGKILDDCKWWRPVCCKMQHIFTRDSDYDTIIY